MIDNRSYYQILQVDSDVSQDEIERAFRRLSNFYQPGINVTPESRKRLRELRESYDVLSNPELRRAYDARLGRRAALVPAKPDAEIRSAGPSAARQGSSKWVAPGLSLPASYSDPTGIPGYVPSTAPSEATNPASDQTVEDHPVGEEIRDERTTSQAWLAYCRTDGQYIAFKLDKTVNAHSILSEFRLKVPEESRFYDAARQEWRVAWSQGPVLRELFLNFDAALAASQTQVPQRVRTFKSIPLGPKPVPLEPAKPYPERTTPRTPVRPRVAVAPIVIAVLALALVYNIYLLVQGVTNDNLEAQATSISMPLIPTPGPRPTATPTLAVISSEPRYQLVNLRAGPGQEYENIRFLNQGEIYKLVGRTLDSTWVQVEVEDTLGWAAAWTMQIESGLYNLPIIEIPTPDQAP